MKLEFNKRYEEVYKAKEIEIKRIAEKNVRVRKIVKDLDAAEDLFEPRWTSDEQPEMLFEVKDEEIVVEKYISEEEQKRLDAVAKEDEGNITVNCFLCIFMSVNSLFYIFSKVLLMLSLTDLLSFDKLTPITSFPGQNKGFTSHSSCC